MSITTQELFVIRNVRTGQLESGYGRYSTPMLYTKSAAHSVAGKMNKKWGCTDYVAVPVEVKEKTALGLEPVQGTITTL